MNVVSFGSVVIWEGGECRLYFSYLCRGGYVFTPVCFVISRIMQRLQYRFPRISVEGLGTDQERTRKILVQIWTKRRIVQL